MERPTVRVKHSPSRCPFCHEDVSSAQAVVCQDCLARHHTGCWEEQGSCSSCHSTRLLVPEGSRQDHAPGARDVSDAQLRSARRIDAELRARSMNSSGTNFLGLNQNGLIMFLALFLTCLPLAFLPWLIPGMREGDR